MIFSIDKGTTNWIKVVAALMIVIHHYSQYAVESLGINNIIYNILHTQPGFFGVSIFFFLSGYGLMESEHKNHLSLQQFLRKRVLKIYIPTVLASALGLSILTIIEKISATNYEGEINVIVENIPLLLYTILFDFGDGVLWFIKTLLLLYAVFFVFTLGRRHNPKIGLIVLVSLTAVVTLFSFKFIGSFTPRGIPFFAIGVSASLYKHLNWKRLNISLLFAVLYCIMLFPVWPDYCITVGLMIAFMLALMLIRVKLSCPAILGALSFDLYLTHGKLFKAGKIMSHTYQFTEFLALAIVIALLFYMLKKPIITLTYKTIDYISCQIIPKIRFSNR